MSDLIYSVCLYTGFFVWVVFSPVVLVAFLYALYIAIMSGIITLYIVTKVRYSDQYPDYGKIKPIDFIYCFIDRFRQLYLTTDVHSSHYGFWFKKKTFLVTLGRNDKKCHTVGKMNDDIRDSE